MAQRRTIVIGFIALQLDAIRAPGRWDQWRPTVDICRQDDFEVHELHLLVDPKHPRVTETLTADIGTISPDTVVRSHEMAIKDPWDFEEVYGALHDFASAFPFDPEHHDYFAHVTTGTHVAQICLFLLAESRHL